MIDIDLNDPIGEIRALIGDPSSEFISDATIISAIDKYDSDILKASMALMSLMLTMFSTFADREREGQVEVYYTKLYERYKDRYDDLKKKAGMKKAVPIYIGGTSVKAKSKVIEDLDSFSMYQLPDWHGLQLGNKTLVEIEALRLSV